MTLELPSSAQVEIWRQKVADGTITTEELRKAIAFLREGRMAAGAAKPRGVKSHKADDGAATAQASEDLLKELEDL